MEWYDLVFELIDMRSFSNLWYWIGLAVLWSSVSHFVMGVPFDMLVRARRKGGQAEADFENMVRINVNRIVYIDDLAGMWILGFASFMLTTLGLLGFLYDLEFAQAVFLLGAPMVFVGSLTVRTAIRIDRDAPTGEALRRRIVRTRFFIQLIGIVAIFVTALWGMYQNMKLGPFTG